MMTGIPPTTNWSPPTVISVPPAIVIDDGIIISFSSLKVSVPVPTTVNVL